MSSKKRTKTLWVHEPYLAQILAGHKTIEVRVGYDNIRRLRPGDRLWLNDRHLATIRRIGRYANFDELLAREDPAAIAPGVSGDLLPVLRDLYPPDKEVLGAVAIEITPRRYDAILFDMGYTLVFFEPPQEIVVQEALGAIGVERSADQINTAARVAFGEYYRGADTATFSATPDYDRQVQVRLARALLDALGVEADEAVQKTYSAALEAGFGRPGAIRPYPETVDILDTLAEQDYRLGIISNWSWNLRDRVAQAGLNGYFETVWASAYAGCNKPHPGIFYQTLLQMDLLPGRALYVGDSYEHDVAGARNAGLDVVLLDRDGTARDPGCPTIRDLRGVLDLLAID